MKKVEQTVSLNSVIHSESNPEFGAGGLPMAPAVSELPGAGAGGRLFLTEPFLPVSSWPCPVHTLPSVPVFESGVTVPTKLAPGLDSAPSPQADRPQLQKPQLSSRVGSSDQRNLRSPGLDHRPETWPSEEACDSICPGRAPSHTRTEGPEEQRTRGGGRGGRGSDRNRSGRRLSLLTSLMDTHPAPGPRAQETCREGAEAHRGPSGRPGPVTFITFQFQTHTLAP